MGKMGETNMAKNRVNRESSVAEKDRELLMAEMELHKFNGLRPDEASCIRDVYRRLIGSFETVCHKCGGKKTKEIDERSFLCLTCHKRCWFTADTPLFKFKKVRPWLFAQCLLEKGIKLNGSQLAGLMKISKSTGYCIMKKVETLSAGITEESNGKKLLAKPIPDIQIQLREHKRLQDHRKVEGRGGIQTNEPVQEREQDQDPEQNNDLVQSSAVTTTAKMQAEEAKLFAALTDIPQNFDTLLNKLDCDVSWMSATLVFLELKGLVTRLDGDCYVRARKAEELPRVKRTRTRTRKEEASVCQKMRVPIVVSIIDSIKLAWFDISNIIVEQFRRLTGAA
jgi:hypothetical protein